MFKEHLSSASCRLDRAATMLGITYGRSLRCPGFALSRTRLYALQSAGSRQGWEAASTSGRDYRGGGRGRGHGRDGPTSYDRSSTSRFRQRNPDRFERSDNDPNDDSSRYGRRPARPASAPPRRLPYQRDLQRRRDADGDDDEAVTYPRQQHHHEDGDEDEYGEQENHSRPTYGSLSPTSGSTNPSSQDPFDTMHSHLTARLQEGQVIRRETWEKLLGHLLTPRHASSALELLRQDAAVRQAASWDWGTHGYGQTAFQLVQAAAAADAPEIAEQLLAVREELHLTLNKDLVPGLIRKVAATDSDSMSDAHVAVVRRLYEQEAVLRGANSPEAAYELSRVLRRAGDVRGVCSLATQIRDQDMAVRPRLMEDVERWLAKRGVRL